MKKRFLFFMATMLFLTGCSSNQGKEQTTTDVTQGESSETNEDNTSQEESNAGNETNEGENDEDQGESATSEENAIVYPYTYVDAAGREVVIESKIENVVVDYLPLWETLMLLGVKPVGANGAENYIATWDAFEGYDVSGVTDIGSSEINMEAVVALEPDLILTQVADVNNIDIANYEAIANTAVFGVETKMDWRLSLREIGKLLGLEEKAEEVIEEFETQLAESRERLNQLDSEQTVMQMSLMGEGRYFITYREDLYGESGLGLKTPEGYTTEYSYQQISIEAIVDMNPDVIFINVFDGDEAIYDALAETDLWQSLDAYKNDKVYRIDGSGHANSALSTLYTVDFIVDKLIEQ